MLANNTNVIGQFNNSPVLLSPQHADAVCSLALASPRNHERQAATGVPYDEMCAAHIGAFATPNAGKPFVFSNGLAVIPVHGVLLHRDSWSDEYATGYDYVRSRMTAALEDPDVEGIVFDVHSPGGMVAGCFELCDAIFESRGQKPMMAVVDGLACSAAYAIASAVGNINVTPSSIVGSVGVLTMHVSYAGALERMGIKATFIYAGAHKVDGNPYEDLSDEVKAEYQARIDKMYEQFVSQVARNRGIEADAVRATEARVYDAQDASNIGFIDAIRLPYEAVAAFRQGLSGSVIHHEGVTTMSDNTQANDGATAPNANNTDAAAAERARIRAITTNAEAEGRTDLANHLAYDTDMSADAAIAMLAKAPKATASTDAPSATNAFQAAMDATANPNVGGNGGGGGDASDKDARVTRILGNYQLAGGQVRKQG